MPLEAHSSPLQSTRGSLPEALGGCGTQSTRPQGNWNRVSVLFGVFRKSRRSKTQWGRASRPGQKAASLLEHLVPGG